MPTPSGRRVAFATPPGRAAADVVLPGDRVIVGDTWDGSQFAADCAKVGASVQVIPNWFSTFTIGSRGGYTAGVTSAYPDEFADRSLRYRTLHDARSVAAVSATFDDAWEATAAVTGQYVPAGQIMPSDLARLMPHTDVNPAQAQALPDVLAGRSTLLVAPTGAGKTVVGLAAVGRAIRDGKKAVWLVPQRTLTRQVTADFARWREHGVRVTTLAGDLPTPDTITGDVIVATTEKYVATRRTRAGYAALRDVAVVVVDEIHLLGEPGRGPLLESLLADLRRDTVQIVGLSATAENAGQVAEWLGAVLVTTHWAPTRTVRQFLPIPPGTVQHENRDRTALTCAIVESHRFRGGQVVVFVPTKRAARDVAVAIHDHRAGQPLGQVKNDDALYRELAAAQVGIHHSTWPYKTQTEAAFRDRRCTVIVATSTLAAGMNLPARAVVVWKPYAGMDPMPVSMLQQMFGRAGRAGYEPRGFAYLLDTPDDLLQWQHDLQAGYTIQSHMAGEVVDHLLAGIVQGAIRHREAADEWWQNTFARFTARRAGVDVDTGVVERGVRFLVDNGFVEVDGDGRYVATRHGQVTSRMMIPVKAGTLLVQGLVRAGDKPPRNPLSTVIAQVARLFEDAAGAPAEHAAKISSIVDHDGVPPQRAGAGQAKRSATGRETAQAAMLVAAFNERAWLARSATVLGVPRGFFYPGVYDSPRVFGWVAAVGEWGAVPGWAADAARDLHERFTRLA